MNTQKILSWLVLLFGEAIIISAFFLFRGNSSGNTFALNIFVSTFVYLLLFLNFRAPWIDLKDQTQKQIGAIGISWFVIWSYALFAIGFMFVANFVIELSFKIQLIVHCGLLFYIFLGYLLSSHSADKVSEVFSEETSNRNGIIEMKKSLNALKNRINETENIPEPFVQRINLLDESLRYISPTENKDAHDMENSFVEIVNEIRHSLQNYSLNEKQIERNLNKCEQIYKNRKNIYSK